MRPPLDGTLRLTNPFGGSKFDAPFDTNWAGQPVHVLGHTGVDFDAAPGSVVRAVWPGTVRTGWDDFGFGNYLVLTTDDGREALYGHLSSFGVASGARVAAGQEVARSGQSGRATGPHLHFEIRERNADRGNGYYGCRDPLGGFDHDVIARLDVSLIGGFCV